MPYRVGQTATNPKTGQKVQWDGANWVGVAGSLKPSGGGKMSPQTQNFLNTLSTQAADAAETRRVYERARQDVSALQPGPYQGAFMQAATPEDNGGIFDRLGAIVIGAPARLTGAITPKETEAYQRMRGLQSQQVLQAQLAQKGPQTESDAARMMLTELSPGKTAAVNEDIISKGIAKTDRARAKAIFYSQFANKWGLNGVTPHGYTADQLWASDGNRITQSLFGPKPKASAPDIRIISRQRVR
jgi:hypothetical protein